MTPDLSRAARALAVSHGYNAEMMTTETVETYARDVRVVLRALREASQAMATWRAMIDHVLGEE